MCCSHTTTTETPHPIHGAKISCGSCGKFIKWKGKKQDPLEYYLKMAAIAKDKGMKPGWAWHQFKNKFGRPPNWEEMGETAPESEWDHGIIRGLMEPEEAGSPPQA